MARPFLPDEDAKLLRNGKNCRDSIEYLHSAVQHGYVQLVQLTLEPGADPDMGDAEGRHCIW